MSVWILTPDSREARDPPPPLPLRHNRTQRCVIGTAFSFGRSHWVKSSSRVTATKLWTAISRVRSVVKTRSQPVLDLTNFSWGGRHLPLSPPHSLPSQGCSQDFWVGDDPDERKGARSQRVGCGVGVFPHPAPYPLVAKLYTVQTVKEKSNAKQDQR